MYCMNILTATCTVVFAYVSVTAETAHNDGELLTKTAINLALEKPLSQTKTMDCVCVE